ncbi:sacsin N-terminal ATP-binding-like domain-containing protein [Rhizobium leguminosarum]|uniref:sacsin N-terminal ATP-binding-like domain-containing protein n=1 Tax=Rhizobium leguminosarum TaxID=384 RepID=UPI00103EEA6C|nr:hypothetical protein [Rhizobium leguminosarum]TBZ73809.1 hypothetical protein E0H61_28275 [Rhizobium leguminosarum bv. viciae]
MDIADVSDDDRKLLEAAHRAATLIWNEDDAVHRIADPFNSDFAAAFVEALNRHLQSAGRMIHRVLEGAARSAEGVNVEPFHGVVEVIQNADDQGAGEVRFSLRDGPRGRQMLLVHDGLPVTFHHVAGMMLPYVTTKEDDADQRGRFGIGLKTLRRISDGVAVHSGPYHFRSGAGVSIQNAPAELPIEDFFDAQRCTMLVLDLVNFDETAFEAWFADWTDDSLVFLDRVRRFVWHRHGERVPRKTLASDWTSVGETIAGAPLDRRTVVAGTTMWTVYRAMVPVPPDQSRAHKRTSSSTPISVAVSGKMQLSGLFVGFRTRVPTSCPFAIDGQFDPSSSREGILDDGWNKWLVDRTGEVIAAAAIAMLAHDPSNGWQLVPLPGDVIGDAGTRWPRERFHEALDAARQLFVENAVVHTNSGDYTLAELAYESDELSALLDEEDVIELAGRAGFVDSGVRDANGRWRRVLDFTGVAAQVGPADLIEAIGDDAFASKQPTWWVELAATLTGLSTGHNLHGIPLWLRDDGRRVAAHKIGSSRLLVDSRSLTAFATRYDLFDLLHRAYDSERGRQAIAWLKNNAAYSRSPGNEAHLLAFAEKHAGDPLAMDDDTLQELKVLLDPVTGTRAMEIGAMLGAAVLLEAFDGKRGAETSLVQPSQAYLPRTIDKDNPNWPNAAAGLTGMLWVLPSYEDRLRTGLGRARKREDGVRPRGARTFLSLLGVCMSPRLVTAASGFTRTASQRSAIHAADANSVPQDWRSSDIERVLAVITGEQGRESVKARRERATWLLRCLAREWDRYAGLIRVPAEKIARVHTRSKGTVFADWVCRLREAEWIPVGKTGFRRPSEAVLKNASTEAVYSSSDFVAGVAAGDVPEKLADALGLVRRVRGSDLVETLERMRSGEIPFDPARVRLAYRQLAALTPRTIWEQFGDLPASKVRDRFAAGGGLIVVDGEDGRPTWRRPDQVLRGKRVLPITTRYVPEGEAYVRLWWFLNIPETGVADCCDFLKEHAERSKPDSHTGVLIEIYRFLDHLLSKENILGRDGVRHIPLSCGGHWRAKRPVHLVEKDDLRAGLARALPDWFFWDPPCRPSTIPHLVEALALTRLAPRVLANRSELAAQRGEGLSHRFHEAVSHLSDQLARTSTDMREALTVGWERFKGMPMHVHDDAVPVTVTDVGSMKPVDMTLRVHLSHDPFELHIAEDAIGNRDEGGRAIGSLFSDPSKWNFDAEWALAWQEAAKRDADGLRFVADEDERRQQLEQEAAKITAGTKSKGNMHAKSPSAPSKGEPPAPLPPRRLKSGIAGVDGVTVVVGQQPKPAAPKRAGLLRDEPGLKPRQDSGPVANTAYNTGELENFGWEVARYVLDHSDRAPLVDFRNQQRVGADGAIDWDRFVELKAFGRTMSGSVQLTLAEFTRAARDGSRYLLVLVSGLEEGFETRVKIIFDPVSNSTVSTTELVRLSGLATAPGIELVIGDETSAVPVTGNQANI